MRDRGRWTRCAKQTPHPAAAAEKAQLQDAGSDKPERERLDAAGAADGRRCALIADRNVKRQRSPPGAQAETIGSRAWRAATTPRTRSLSPSPMPRRSGLRRTQLRAAREPSSPAPSSQGSLSRASFSRYAATATGAGKKPCAGPRACATEPITKPRSAAWGIPPATRHRSKATGPDPLRVRKYRPLLFDGLAFG